MIFTGCGSSPIPGGGATTSVTLFSTSTANDQLSEFGMIIDSMTLSNASGNTVNLISSPLHIEFLHVNGREEPLLTVKVPQGVYTAATAAIEGPNFTCVTINPAASNALDVMHFAGNANPNATVSVASPISITGSIMDLSLNLLVSQSASASSCNPGSSGTFSLTPTFNLSPLMNSSVSGETGAIIVSGLNGMVTSVDVASNSFVVAAADGSQCIPDNGGTGGGCSPVNANGPVWQVTSDSTTAWQGASNLSNLASGVAVDMDAAIQSDGSLLATRVAVHDTDASNLSLAVGPLLFVSAAQGYPDLLALPVGELGPLGISGYIPYNFGNATFQVSDQFSNLGHLPFTPTYTSATMVDGQDLYATTHAFAISPSPTDVPATTVTLLPQTINGTLSAIGSEGNFTTYTVMLAPYDLFPTLAAQAGQTSPLTDPSTVVVYADSTTQMLDTNPVAVGGVYRFYGLVFNDNGTLRMDCAQISDGVTE